MDKTPSEKGTISEKPSGQESGKGLGNGSGRAPEHKPKHMPEDKPEDNGGPSRGRVGLFVTCLVDLFRPSIGFAAIALLERAGYRVFVPESQTCCGQPAYNSGDRRDAAALARNVIRDFANFDYVVAPSGSCAAMLRHHYPDLLRDDDDFAPRAVALAERTYELTAFLADIAGYDPQGIGLRKIATYHDSCSGLRELGIREQPRRLLQSVEGLALREMDDPEACCGFGGTFCVKYGEISTEIVARKVADAAKTGAEMLLAGDMGCLMNMAGRLRREGRNIEVRHVAEVLAGMTEDPPIGQGEER